MEKGKPTYEFGRDSIDMLMKVGVAIENLERTVAKGGVLTFDTSDRLATIIAETSLGDMIKEHERYLHLTMTPEKGGIGDR